MIETITTNDFDPFEEIRRESRWNGRVVKALSSDSITISISWKFMQSAKYYRM